MRNKGKRLGAALGCLLLLCAAFRPVCAEDCFVLDVDALDMDRLNNNEYVAQNLTACAKGLCVQKYISDSSELAEPVRLTIMRMDTQTLLMDKDYGYQSKAFDSGVIYLTYSGSGTIPYLVTLYVGNTVYAMPFMQLQPRLEYNSACTCGLRLSDLGLSSDWLMGAMLDLNELRAAGYATLDICASNAYIIGQAVVQMQGEALCVQLDLNAAANVEVLGLSLYIIPNCAVLTGDPVLSGLPASAPGQWVDVTGAASALLYMPMQVSYDPAGLPFFGYDLGDASLQGQLALWDQNRSGGTALPVQATETPPEAWLGLPSELEAPGEEALPEVAPVIPAGPTAQAPEAAEAEALQEQPPEAVLDNGQPPEADFFQTPPEALPVAPTAPSDPTPPPQPNGSAGFDG